MNEKLVCVATWQTKTVLYRDRQFMFSPFGLGRIDGWVLLRWRRLRKCDLGHYHAVERWDHPWGLSPGRGAPPVPLIPREVWRELGRKTKNAQKQPWPGGDWAAIGK